MEHSFLVCGDMALTVQFEKKISEDVNARVTALAHSLRQEPIKGVTDFIPTFASVTVCYDCTIISARLLIKKLEKLINKKNELSSQKKRVFIIPVCYDHEFGGDMDNVIACSGLSREQIIEAHSQRDYLIYMLGFLPGFVYLGGMDKRLNTPRLDNPRTVIPAGSVGIGGEQTGIYPIDSPGGWQLIGRTPVKVYDNTKPDPILYRAGDYIRFKPVERNEFYRIAQLEQQGQYQAEVLFK